MKSVRTEGSLGLRPLYRQAYDVLVARIADRRWTPGQMLPSEAEIAVDLGVSPGTVRKALDRMTAENLLVRRQGRGTFVAQHDDQRILFQFFKLVRDDGERQFPDSRVLEVRVAPAGAETAAALDLQPGESTIRIDRIRDLGGVEVILEHIAVPHRLFCGLETETLPNNLYQLYATRFGVTIARATERLKAVCAGTSEAENLGVPIGSPLLSVDRVALGVDGTKVERRVTLCRTEGFHYLSDLR